VRTIFAIIVTAVFLASASAAFAAPTAAIAVPAAGDYYYWFSYADVAGKQVTTTPRSFKDKKTTADLPLVKDAVPKCKLFVLDAKTGNEAVVLVEGKPGETFKFDLKSSDFDRVRKVEVFVTAASSGLPAAAGVVKLEDAEKGVQTQILDPSAKGVLQFSDVPSGTAKVTVLYGDGKSASQDIEIPLDGKEAVPRVEIPVVGEIDTVQPAAKEEAGPAAKPSGETGERAPGRGINFPMALVGLALLVLILYAASALMRSRGAGFRQILKRFGIEVPEEPQAAAPSQPAPAQQVDPTICPFCGGKKDPATGACACSVGAAVGAPAVSSGPRLIATQGVYAGSIYQLESAPVTIGREESNTVAFPQDSTVSRRHARITSDGGQFTVHDEGSSNGTFVNGVKVAEKVLQPGDEIQIGGTRLRFEV